MNQGPEILDLEDGSWLGERLRRLALAITAALIVARAYWPSEATSEVETGNGLGWAFAFLIGAALAVLSWFIGGVTRLRFSWADVGVLGLILIVALSANHALERRVAINLAWQWGSVGIAYFLLRQLPRTRGESSALVGILVATALAVATYGLYQVTVELPQLRQDYLEDPIPKLIEAGVDPNPNSPSRQQFEYRFLYSTEPFSTFALANSLAGFLVGPLVLMIGLVLENLRRRPVGEGGEESPALWPITIALVPFLIVLVCLLLTKSRSAYAGLGVGGLLLAWRLRRRIPTKPLLLATAGLVTVLAGLVGMLLALGWLDKEVLTQTNLSMRYRLEYWQGTWNLLWSNEPTASGASKPVWWWGVGPGNFRGPYLRHKLLESSEEIVDPHNIFLEVWAIGGLLAALALLLALGAGFWNLFAKKHQTSETLDQKSRSIPPPAPLNGLPRQRPDLARPPTSSRWLVFWAGLGGWLGVVLLGHINVFGVDDAPLIRWLILGFGWLLAVGLGSALWNRRPIAPAAIGAALAAILVNLLAAGGIGYAPVALMFWGLLALGLNLRDDRPCGLWRVEASRWVAFFPALVLTALIGTFTGAIVPFWESRTAMAEADALIERGVRGPRDFETIAKTITSAAEADVYSVTPWLALAEVEYRAWQARRSPLEDAVWNRIEQDLARARKRPRNPYSLDVQRRRILYARRLLQEPGLPESIERQLWTIIIDASGKAAVSLHPTSTILRAQLAEALAELEYFQGAAIAAKVALELDQTPHEDKRLPDDVRQRLQKALPFWERSEDYVPYD